MEAAFTLLILKLCCSPNSANMVTTKLATRILVAVGKGVTQLRKIIYIV